jgi:hypothetical protein
MPNLKLCDLPFSHCRLRLLDRVALGRVRKVMGVSSVALHSISVLSSTLVSKLSVTPRLCRVSLEVWTLNNSGLKTIEVHPFHH